jgi:RsiW-degrading membrane proteinase PrsW (M82 family)
MKGARPFPTEIEAMNRGNIFFLVIGALVVIAGVLSYQLYQDRKQPKGVEILLGPNGVIIEKK